MSRYGNKRSSIARLVVIPTIIILIGRYHDLIRDLIYKYV
jgi:hypothetical protein